MKKICLIISVLAISLFLVSPASAALFLDSWGVNPDTNTWVPTSAPSHLFYEIENFTGSGPGYVDPGWGGHAFDASAAYIAIEGWTVHIAVVTGLPQNGNKDIWRYNNSNYNGWYDWNQSLEKYWYDPGDIAIDINSDGSYEYAITTRLDNDKSSYAPAPGEGGLLSGNLQWEDPKAYNYYENYTDWGGVSNPWAVTSYDNLLDLGANFSYGAFGADYFAIEAIFDLSYLGLKNGDEFTIHWTMECGNDYIELYDPIVPEPSTVLLLSSGIAGLAFYSRRKFRR